MDANPSPGPVPRGPSRPVLLAGPTASGKSALALALADALGGVVVNADALQVYAEWRVLTARPSAADEARAPHLLYGHTPAADATYSTGRWLREIEPILRRLQEKGETPIFVGGTGLYFKALTEGLAEIPPTPAEIRAAGEAELAARGPAAFAAALAARDPDTAARIDMANPRRVLRAYEVLETTGVGFAAWMDRTPPPLLPLSATLPLKIEPPRDALRRRIAARFSAMIGGGALDEAAAMAAREADGAVPEAAPALKALGYAPLKAYLDGRWSRDRALASGVIETSQYAKRQATWLRNQMAAWRTIPNAEAADVAALAAAARGAPGPEGKREETPHERRE